MAKLLDQELPKAPTIYEVEAFDLIFSDVERALSTKEFPDVVANRDDVHSVDWFMS
tara:strand:- start:268 stop:435 length:168 start_codon:yes stop_codon:yes gene_type:complete